MSYKSTDGLMRHLRKTGISISGSRQKQHLLNTGYFHGYKGYRFFKTSQQRLPFTSYDEVYATIQYDTRLKSLFYSRVMFIETAVKNLALECMLAEAKSENIQTICNTIVCSYNNAPTGTSADERRKYQQKKLNLQNTIQSYLTSAYKNSNPKITHFYNNTSHADVPIWALFEIITMGDLGYFLSCLTPSVRAKLSRRLNFQISYDSNFQLIYKYIYLLKELRNSIAHNSVIFDTRFRSFDPTPAMKLCLVQEIGLSFVNFKSIEDYVILMCYYLKAFKVPKTEIKAFIRDFEKIVDEYKRSVSPAVAKMVVRSDLSDRMATLKNFI